MNRLHRSQGEVSLQKIGVIISTFVALNERKKTFFIQSREAFVSNDYYIKDQNIKTCQKIFSSKNDGFEKVRNIEALKCDTETEKKTTETWKIF